jgi:hypothetical protein
MQSLYLMQGEVIIAKLCARARLGIACAALRQSAPRRAHRDGADRGGLAEGQSESVGREGKGDPLK